MAAKGRQHSGATSPRQPGVSPALAPRLIRRTTAITAQPGAHAWRSGLGRLAPAWRGRHALGYLAAVAGVALATGLIALVQVFVHFSNISLLYLIVVLALAATVGRGPAILASILAFLAYDYFFIPPLYQFTIDDPSEWISLSALLATSLVLGQLTAAVQARARDALESQRRTATLYTLSELVASAADFDALLTALAGRVRETFAASGVRACAVLLPDEHGQPVTRAYAGAGADAEPLMLVPREQLAQASWVLEHGKAAGEVVRDSQPDETQQRLCFFVPLTAGRHVIGVLGLVGGPPLSAFVAAATGATTGLNPAHASAQLFAAFCKHIALALDRAELQKEAIHAEALREGDVLKDALLGSVTHDLRTPLAAIQVAGESLLEPEISWSDQERREFAETIVTSADRLGRLVNNLLDLSRLEAGVAVPNKQWYPIGDVIATVLDRLEIAGRTSGRQILVSVNDDVPAVPMDHAQIEEVVTNLIENAVKYSPPRTDIRIVGRVCPESDELEVRVADQGIGIPPGEIEAIFGKFYRVQHTELPWATQRPQTGTGLGLAICAAIVREHDGRIWAESKPGDGATLVFTLPLTAAGRGQSGGDDNLTRPGAPAEPPATTETPPAAAAPAAGAAL
ncbi:MAG: ATP-binding protein [Ktedonobacterales bacterium]